jgi:hypothetical protein
LWPAILNFVRPLIDSAQVREKIRVYAHVPEYDPIGILFHIFGGPVSRFPGLSTALPFDNAPEWNQMKAFATGSRKLEIAPKNACVGDNVIFFRGNAHSMQLSVICKNRDDTYQYVGIFYVAGKNIPTKATKTIVLR